MSEVSDNSLPTGSHESTPKTTIPFGEVMIPRSSEALVSSSERAVYQSGFNNYQQLLAVEDSGIERKKFLLTPAIASVIIGIQPWRHISSDEADVLAGYIQEAGVDILDNFAMIHVSEPTEFGETRSSVDLINIPAARLVLHQNNDLLGTDIHENSPRDQVADAVFQLFSIQDDAYKSHLATGLLSGFPVSDAMWYALSTTTIPSKVGVKRSIGESIQVERDSLQARAEFMQGEFRHISLYPHNDDAKTDSSGTGLHPNDVKRSSGRTVAVRGYGLGWITELDEGMKVKQGTQRYCQKLIQIDEALGLERFIKIQKQEL